MFAEALERAGALQQAGDVAAAERCYKEILVAEPRQFDALHSLGVLEAQRGRYEEALHLVAQALKIEPQSIPAKISYGNVLKSLNRHLQALAICNEILEVEPDSALALYNRGNVLLELDRFDEALNDYDRVMALMPDNAPALYNRGCVLQKLKRHAEALACFDRVLELMPGNFETIYNRGAALLKLRRYEDALVCYGLALTIAPDDVEVLTNRGVSLYELKRWDDALASFDKALSITPGYADAWSNRGNVLLDLKRPQDALASWDRALGINPNFTQALNNRGPALHELQRHAEAIASYERALQIDPDYEYLLGTLLDSRMHICDWTNAENQLAQIAEQIEGGKKAVPPFSILGLSDSLDLQRKSAQIWVADKYPLNDALRKHQSHTKHDKIKIGYFSADFRNHPVSQLTAKLFESHDRSRFEITGFSFGPDTRDELRKRMESAFDNFIDLRQKSDKEGALLARQMEIDIAVDMGGFTDGARPGIFALRAAPLQINFLGYPATMGTEYMDYIFADATIVPENAREFYAEKVAFLPSYQPNDSTRHISNKKFTKAGSGLPHNGFVFCCFNNHYKITPQVFDSWMGILGLAEGSVLWLSEGNPAIKENLRKEARLRAVDPDRLIFAKREQLLEDHLARHRLADLFIDTSPYNAHTTASDALWAGLPVLTCIGTTFAGRVAASLLNAVGLPELIAQSPEEYEALAVEMATQPARLAALKAKLAINRTTHPLFDTDRYCRHLETAYLDIWERAQRGEPPASFAVSAT